MSELETLQQKFEVPLSQATMIPEEIRELYRKPELLKIVLTTIHELENRTPTSFETWKMHFCEKVGWLGLPSKSVSRALFELTKHDFMVQWLNERNRHLGYILTKRGLETIGVQTIAPKGPPETIEVDIGPILENNISVFMTLADVGQQLKTNREQRLAKLDEIAALDREYERIINCVEEKFIYNILMRIS